VRSPRYSTGRRADGARRAPSAQARSTTSTFDPLHSDEPAGLGGADTAPNPVEQLLAALGNCLAVGYAANASVAGSRLDELAVDLV
jgi:uncharacterized OsmC-like protein